MMTLKLAMVVTMTMMVAIKVAMILMITMVVTMTMMVEIKVAIILMIAMVMTMTTVIKGGIKKGMREHLPLRSEALPPNCPPVNRKMTKICHFRPICGFLLTRNALCPRNAPTKIKQTNKETKQKHTQKANKQKTWFRHWRLCRWLQLWQSNSS